MVHAHAQQQQKLSSDAMALIASRVGRWKSEREPARADEFLKSEPVHDPYSCGNPYGESLLQLRQSLWRTPAAAAS